MTKLSLSNQGYYITSDSLRSSCESYQREPYTQYIRLFMCLIKKEDLLRFSCTLSMTIYLCQPQFLISSNFPLIDHPTVSFAVLLYWTSHEQWILQIKILFLGSHFIFSSLLSLQLNILPTLLLSVDACLSITILFQS